jgi:uracil-DNA glycosylase family 4
MARTYSTDRVRRRSVYRSLLSLQRDNRVCRACADAGYQLESMPVFEGRPRQRALLVGQAPGAAEGIEGRPWRGRAGKTLRRWLELDEDRFYETFYCASVTRCYPGKSPSGRGDRTPAPPELALCRFWLDYELRLLAPELCLIVGGLAARQLLGVRTLTEHVGTRLAFHNAVAIPLPHPSGASGWLNDASNRERLDRALALVREELSRLA